MSLSTDSDRFFQNQWQITVTPYSSSELTTVPNRTDTGDSVGWLHRTPAELDVKRLVLRVPYQLIGISCHKLLQYRSIKTIKSSILVPFS